MGIEFIHLVAASPQIARIRIHLVFFYKERSELVTSWSFSYFYSRSLKSFFRVSNFYSRSLQSFFKFSENCILYQPFLGQI